MSNIQDNLLRTLDALTAQEQVSKEIRETHKMVPGEDYDPDTGEYLREPDEGYKPVVEAPSLENISPKESKVADLETSDASTDYKRVRDTTYAIQEATLFMLGQAAKLAVITEAPRAFTMFKELGELARGLNKDLMENQKMFKAVTADIPPPGGEVDEVSVTTDSEGNVTTTVKKARSSRDLLKMMEEVKKEAAAKEAVRQSSSVKENEEIIDVESEEQGEEDGAAEA